MRKCHNSGRASQGTVGVRSAQQGSMRRVEACAGQAMNARRQSCGGKPRAPAAADARGAPRLGPGTTCGGHHGRGESLPVPPTHARRGHGELLVALGDIKFVRVQAVKQVYLKRAGRTWAAAGRGTASPSQRDGRVTEAQD